MFYSWTVSLFLVALGLVVAGQGLMGPKYRTYKRQCMADRDCDRSLGEVCWWLYDGCAKGHCMCDPHSSAQLDDGRCKPLRLGNQACSSRYACPHSMVCRNATCQCLTGRMSDDKRWCILPQQKMLGEACYPSRDTCFHKAEYGYTTSDIECPGGGSPCQCMEGYKAVGETCQKLTVGDWGCVKEFHCEGGAICLDGRCVCPTGYMATARSTKCAKIGATTNFPLGSRCDEVNEARYCAFGLVCQRCNGARHYTCVRYQLSNKDNYVGNKGSSNHDVPTSRISALLFLALCVLVCTACIPYAHR